MKNRNLYLEEFRLYLLKNDKAKTTIKTYIENVNLFIRWCIAENDGEFTPETINELDIIDWRDFLQEEVNQNENTINLKLASIKSYCSFLYTEKYISSNPSSSIKRVKSIDNDTAKSFDEKEYKKIRRHILKIGNKQHWAMWNILTNCGVRNSELTNIKLDDIQISDRKGRLRVRGKGNKIRYVPLNNLTRNSIIDWLEERNVLQVDCPHLFISERKSQFTRSGIWKIFNKYFFQVGLSNYSVHSCRHYFCRTLLKNGVDLSVVAALAGHSSGFITSKVYTKPREQELEDAINKL